MKVVELNSLDSKARLSDTAFDCVWVFLDKKAGKAGPVSEVTQWLDWKMGGAVSRLLKEEKLSSITYLPPMKRLKSRLVAVDFIDGFDSKKFAESVEGLQPTSICCIIDNEDDLRPMKKEIEKMKTNFPVGEIVFVTE